MIFMKAVVIKITIKFIFKLQSIEAIILKSIIIKIIKLFYSKGILKDFFFL